jgi:two-component system, sensor histidine kinase and response regulator
MSAPGTVLVVDDNAENRALAQATLEDEGFVVELASNGEQALAAFARTAFDCVLLDVRMPGMDGIAVCNRMRAQPNGPDVPILFVTAQRDVETFDRARDAGGDDYITKPFRPNELIARVAAAARLRRMAAERNELFELIRQQRDDLMRLQLQKEQLVAFLVHDLKNPVNAIELHGQRILRDRTANERARDAAQSIRSETRSLLRMIMNLLDLSKADEGRLVPRRERVELQPLFAQIVGDMEVRAHAGAVTLDAPPCDLAVTGDPDLVRRIVENLVDNALRHAPEQSVVRLVAAPVENATVELRVADQGPGVPAAERELVFERFVQTGGPEGTSMRGGRGLGLAFCKLAVEAHGGRIWIEDAAPGAVFCVRLPAAS